MIGFSKFVAGGSIAAAAGGMYLGARTAPDGLPQDERLERGLGVAGAFALVGGAGAAYLYAAPPDLKGMAGGAFRSAMNSIAAGNTRFRAEFAAGKPLRDEIAAAQKAGIEVPEATMLKRVGVMRAAGRSYGFGAFIGAGALLGGGIGAAVSPDHRGEGAAKGAAIGAGAGAAAKIALSASDKLNGAGVWGKKAGIAGGIALASVAAFTALRGMTRQPESMVYASTDESGSTDYSYSPVADRARAMNAEGDLVFGLHRARH